MANDRRSAEGRIALVVLGMHRSGTSALTGMLSKLGASAPLDLLDAGPDNPRGYWESRRVMELNDAILAHASATWSSLDGGRLVFEPADRKRFESLAVEAIEASFESAPLFVLKEPRLCRLWNVWGPALACAGVEARFIHPIRNPDEVAASLSTRDHMSRHEALASWLEHSLGAELASRGRPRVFVTYDQVLSDWRAAAARITRGLGLEWPHELDAVATDVDGFLTGDLRHHHAGREVAPRASDAWARRAYEAMRAAATDDGEAGLGERLDAVRAEYETAYALFGPPLRRTRLALAAHEREAEARQLRLDELEASLASKEASLASKEASLASKEVSLARAEAAATETLAALRRSRSLISGLEARVVAIARIAQLRGQRSWLGSLLPRKRESVANRLLTTLATVPLDAVQAEQVADLSLREELDFVRYHELHVDVAEAGMNPVVHYVMHGRVEGRELPTRSASPNGSPRAAP